MRIARHLVPHGQVYCRKECIAGKFGIDFGDDQAGSERQSISVDLSAANDKDLAITRQIGCLLMRVGFRQYAIGAEGVEVAEVDVVVPGQGVRVALVAQDGDELEVTVEGPNLGVLADLMASTRVVSQRTLERVRRIELTLGVAPSHYERVDPSRHRESQPKPAAQDDGASTVTR